ncbi:MAG TPA: MFS transporter [Thermomicrobiales bacterium]|nr:MFS transporter [Thermomicrobiales bacterium]
MSVPSSTARIGATAVLLTLAAGQFIMTLDSSVMNVSIATVANDVGTSVTGIQTAITLYTLVMASLMIIGGKIGAKIGFRRAFMLGCLIYGAGSLTTALAPNLTVLLIGWSLLEGIGATLILPSIVALIAVNFATAERPRAFGIVSAAGAIAVAAGPLIGGFMTTYFSWRWVFVGEVVGVIVIFLVARKLSEPERGESPPIDLVGAVLTAAGLGGAVFGVLKSAEWGWVRPKPDGASLLGISGTFWLIVGGLLVLWLMLQWELRLVNAGRVPLIDPAMFKNQRLTGGLLMFFLQFLIQAGVFFVIPLYLSIVLGLSALDTGIRLLPLSVALLIAALGVPRFFPNISPRLVVRLGVFGMLCGILLLLTHIDLDAGVEVVALPLLLLGAGIGALASQLGSVTVSSVPDSESAEVGGLQNTATNLGASLGTALAGSVMIAVLTSSLIGGINTDAAISNELASTASVELSGGVPFVSDDALEQGLDTAGITGSEAAAILDANRQARIDGLDAALALIALFAAVALFAAQRIQTYQPGASEADTGPGPQAAG